MENARASAARKSAVPGLEPGLELIKDAENL